MYRNHIAAALLFVVGAVLQASPASAVVLSVADYQDDFQAITPVAGWQYQYNSLGAIGIAANYTDLSWNTGVSQYTIDPTEYPDMPDGNYAAINAVGGHVGPGTGNGAVVASIAMS